MNTDRASRGNLDQIDGESPSMGAMLPEVLPESPFGLFRNWFDEAAARKVQPNPNAMTLATIDPDGKPSARIVLLKGMDLERGFVVFYTNYLGRKGRALVAHRRAAAVMHWDVLDRQVRIEGPVVRSPAAESDAYFQSRPWMSRIGAWTSEQSEPVASRAAMTAKLHATYRRFGLDPESLPAVDAKVEIPRPPHWGGFRIYVERMELWLGGEGRLHDRAAWERRLEADGVEGYRAGSAWCGSRLQP